ncbi:MAG TPA: hypothetical protein DCE23_07220 [Firmicutes bacterium]|nr:hypothetical protein [Bacillota bacterium]
MNYNYNYNNVYTPPENYENYNNDNNNNNKNNGGSGFFGTLITLAVLLFLVYILLGLLGIDVKEYVKKYFPKKEEMKETKEENDKKNEEVIKVKVKDYLKEKCNKLDGKGSFDVTKYGEEAILNGSINYCLNYECMYIKGEYDDEKAKNLDDEENIVYSYTCKEDIYTEMPKENVLDEIRIKSACSSITDGIYEKKYEDGINVKCENNVCVLSGENKVKEVVCTGINDTSE